MSTESLENRSEVDSNDAETSDCPAVVTVRKRGSIQNLILHCGQDCLTCPLVDPRYAETMLDEGECSKGNDDK